MGGLFGGGGGSGKIVKPPKPLQLNLGDLQTNMVGADQAAYAQGDQYMSKYYPDLTQARDNMIGQSFKNLTGPLDPTLENTFVNQGNMQSASALGAGNQDYGFDPGGGKFGGAGAGSSWGGSGSLARNAAAATVATDTQANQDYNRTLFEQLNTQYSPRSFGMTPEDAANVFTFNNTQFNNYQQQLQAAQTASYYQSVGAGNAASAAGTSAAAGLTSALITGLAAY